MISLNELKNREKNVIDYFKQNSIEDFVNQRQIVENRINALRQEANKLESLKNDLFHDINYYYFIAWDKTIPK